MGFWKKSIGSCYRFRSQKLNQMKKLFSTILVLGLLWCNVGFAINEPFDLWCKSYKKEFYDGDKKILKSVSESYQIHLTNDEAFVVGLEGLYNNLIRSQQDTQSYFYTSMGYNGRSSVVENNKIIPFDSFEVDRTSGEARLSKWIINIENIYMKCSKEKPKLLF